MKVKAIKTEKVIPGKKLFEILDKYVDEFSDGSILAITSKIVSICEGRIIRVGDIDKEELIKQEADLYLPRNESKYDLYLTIKDNLLAVSAGIDESNSNGYYVLWPREAQKTANEVREYLQKKFGLKKIGVIITDSKTTPLRWGVTGAAIAYSGIKPLKNLIGTPDIFGRKLKMTKMGILDGLAAAAVLEMGEGDNQTPIAIISDIPFVEFVSKDPSKEELAELKISIDDDVYAPLLKNARWKKGGK